MKTWLVKGGESIRQYAGYSLELFQTKRFYETVSEGAFGHLQCKVFTTSPFKD